MRNPEPKSQYVDVSYGWQNRNEAALLQGRRRRWRWGIVLGAALVLVVLIYLTWRLS